jgi:hypothetical protein
MQTATINDAYSMYNELSLEDKEYFIGLIEKQIIDARRNAILERAKEAKENYIKGNVFSGSINDIMEYLENDSKTLFSY